MDKFNNKVQHVTKLVKKGAVKTVKDPMTYITSGVIAASEAIIKDKNANEIAKSVGVNVGLLVIQNSFMVYLDEKRQKRLESIMDLSNEDFREMIRKAQEEIKEAGGEV